MHCSVCGHDNQPGAKFCANCGNALTITCPVCAQVSPPDAKFCSNCGTALDAAAATTETPEGDSLQQFIPPEMLQKLQSARAGKSMAGERRTVTMLFADIKGSTAAAEQLDPEEWADLMNSAFARLIEPIYRYEGTLAQLLGDAVLAFFGAPIAHDDDPIRAVRAGLDIIEGMDECKADILEQFGIPIEVRVGINTGLVVVGEVGSDLRVEYTALGDAINIAARMEQTAQPGTVQISERTHALTHGAFAAENLGPVEVKGKSEPIVTYRPTAFLGVSPEESLEHRFVGREDELATLANLVDRLEGDSGWIASIIGEAGLGKSALLREWSRRVLRPMGVARHPTDEGDMALMIGASQSYDASRPMSGVRDLLERWFDLDGIDDLSKIRAACEGIEDPDLGTLIAHAVGVALPEDEQAFIDALAPPIRLGRVRAAASAYVAAEAARRPLIIGFEDLHWSDDLTIDLIGDLLVLTETEPIGIVFSMRPYRDDPSWRVHERAARDHAHRYTDVTLEPLGESSSEQLITDLLGDSGIDQASLAALLERSAGNPLFLEEIATSLERGGTIEGVPDSLSGVLVARLDRLDEQSRLVAQVSSVLGTEFRRDTVHALVDVDDLAGTITELLRQGIFIESRMTPGRLQFRHALLQDAAYSSVLLKTRRVLHGEVAHHLAEVAPDAASEIARHFVAADDYHNAFPFLVKAGGQATTAMALADAIRDFRMAIDHAPEDADKELLESAHLGLGQAYALLPDLSESAAAFQRLFEYGEKADRPTAQVAALNNLAYTTATVGGDTEEANKYLNQARALAEATGDERGLLEYHMNACMIAAFNGDPGQAAMHDQSTTDIAAALGDERIRVEGLKRRAINQALVLDLDQAEESFNLAIGAAEQLGMEESFAELRLIGLGTIMWTRGDYRHALALSQEQLPILERFSSFNVPFGHTAVGQLHLELGDPEAALASFMEGRRSAQQYGQPFVEALGTAGMAATYSLLGDRQRSVTLLAETRIGEGPMGDYYASSSWYYLSLAHFLNGDASIATDAFTRGIAAPAVVQYLDRTRLLVGLSRALTTTGDLERSTTIVEEAREFATEKKLAVATPSIALADGELQAALGNGDGARERLQASIEAADHQDQVWVALQAAWSLAKLTGDPGSAPERTEAIASTIIDQDLAASFRVRWLESAAQTS